MAMIGQWRQDPEYWSVAENAPGRWECRGCGTTVRDDHADDCRQCIDCHAQLPAPGSAICTPCRERAARFG